VFDVVQLEPSSVATRAAAAAAAAALYHFDESFERRFADFIRISSNCILSFAVSSA